MRFEGTFRTRVLLLGLSLCLAVLCRPAQGQISIGIVGGANYSSLKDVQANGNLVSFDNASAFHLGVFLDLKLGPIGLRPSVVYLNTGKLFRGGTFLDADDFDLSYISIPVDVIYTIGLGPLKPYLFAGPDFRLLTGGNAPLDLEENLRNFVMSASAGVGIALSIPGTSLKLYPQIRYSFGISELTDASYQVGGISVETGGNSKVNMWMLSLGVGF